MSLERNARESQFLRGLESVVVAGFGRSGRAAAALLAKNGVTVTVVDARPREEHAEVLASLPASPLFVHEDRAGGPLVDADLVVISPGIDPSQEPYAAAVRADIQLPAAVQE